MSAPPTTNADVIARIREVYPIERARCAWCNSRKSHHFDCPVPDVHALLKMIDALLATPEREDEKTDGAGLIHQAIPDMAGTEPRPDTYGKCFQPFIGDEPRVGRTCESQQYHLRDCVTENVLPPGALFAVTRLNTVVMGLANGEATVGEYATAREALIRVCLRGANAAR